MKHGLARDLEIRDCNGYQDIGGFVCTSYHGFADAPCKVVDVNLQGCFYVVEREDGARTKVAFRSATRAQ